MTEIQVTTDGPYIYIREDSGDGPPHRRALAPGRFIDGAWTETDLSDEPPEVRDAAKEIWTDEGVDAYMAQAKKTDAFFAAPDAKVDPADVPLTPRQLRHLFKTKLDLTDADLDAAIAEAAKATGFDTNSPAPANPLFNADLTLQAGSPEIGAGPGGTNLGA